MAVEIRELRPDDHDNVRALWQGHSGEQSDLQQLLSRQTGLSVIACQEGGVIGTVLCLYDGHDYQHHVAVGADQADGKLAQEMVDKAVRRFLADGRKKCHIHLTGQSDMNDEFWQVVKWCPNDDWTQIPPSAE